MEKNRFEYPMTSARRIIMDIARKKGITMAELARRTGTTPQGIHSLMSGRTRDIDIARFLQMLDAMDCCMSVFDLADAEEFPVIAADEYDREKARLKQ